MAFCVVSDHIIVIRAFPACETNKWFAYSCIFFFFSIPASSEASTN